MSTKKLCINAMGIALFVVFTLCLQVPVFENYYLCLGYIAMAFYTYCLGTASGTLVGTMGVLIYCCLTGGLRGMPGWMLGNIVIGILCGVAAGYSRSLTHRWGKQAVMTAAVLLSTAIGILVIKSITEVVLYALPFPLRVVSNFSAFVADAVVLVLGFGLCICGEAGIREILNKLNIA